jgi:hypothetical protein
LDFVTEGDACRMLLEYVASGVLTGRPPGRSTDWNRAALLMVRWVVSVGLTRAVITTSNRWVVEVLFE